MFGTGTVWLDAIFATIMAAPASAVIALRIATEGSAEPS
jgi:hypothetical protein